MLKSYPHNSTYSWISNYSFLPLSGFSKPAYHNLLGAETGMLTRFKLPWIYNPRTILYARAEIRTGCA
jgi:hypothetical protein